MFISHFFRLVRLFSQILLLCALLCAGATTDVFAAKTASPKMVQEATVNSGSNGALSVSGSGEDSLFSEQDEDERKKEREKTINDINTFLIETYKLKIDRILANLNTSLERVTNNDPVAQAKLLEKIRGDIDAKMQIINSRNISENRKKILSSVFSYIQESLDANISRLVGHK